MLDKISTNTRMFLLLASLFIAYMCKSLLVMTPGIPNDVAFDTDRAFQRLTRILEDEAPHPVDSHAIDVVRERLLDEIRAMGFSPKVDDEFICAELRPGNVGCARVRNVSFWVGPEGADAVLVMSHYDSVPAGPGAADDGIGVASSLEIATLLKGKSLDRPLLVLITDGEEAGLFGAKSFVRRDPRAAQIGAVVNMEARGNRGLATLIQTSRPNSRDLRVMDNAARLPAASSLNADVYDLLPNDTDMTELLTLPVDAANYAISHGASFYHTPGDNLANLDKASLAHIGVNGLLATEAFLKRDAKTIEGQRVYTDILGRVLLSFPIVIAAVLLCFGGIAALIFFYLKRKEGGVVRALLAPGIAVILGIGIAMLATWIVDWVRPERLFGAAHPWALRAVHVSGALVGCVLAYSYICKPSSRRLALASGWIWFAGVGAVLFSIVPGASIMFSPSLLLFGVAAGFYILHREQSAKILALLGVGVFAIISLPLGALGENGLFVEAAAPFVLIAILLFTMLVPFALPASRKISPRLGAPLIASSITLLAFTIASLLVPAYNVNAPRSLSVAHSLNLATGEAFWRAVDGQGFPKAMLAQSKSPPQDKARTLSAPLFDHDGIELAVLSDITKEDARVIEVSITAPNSDRFRLNFRSGAAIRELKFNGETVTAHERAIYALTCSGRSCREGVLSLEMDVEQPAPNLSVSSVYFGLGPSSNDFLEARPEWAMPSGLGDRRILTLSYNLEPEPDAKRDE